MNGANATGVEGSYISRDPPSFPAMAGGQYFFSFFKGASKRKRPIIFKAITK